MKNLFAFLILILFSCAPGFAQSNNPFDNKGLQVKDAVVTLVNDFTTGRLTDYNQQTIDRYTESFSVGTTIPVRLVSNIYTDLTSRNFNYETYINNSGLSADAKRITIEILNSSKNDARDGFQAMLVAKVDEINSSHISETEKELLLTNCSASYHLSTLTNENLQGRHGNGRGDGLGIGFAVGAFAGGAAGVILCGPLCGFGGSIIGGFIGAVIGSLFDK